MMSVTNDPQVVSFEAFYRSEYRSMVALAAAVSGSTVHAEDLAQEALWRAHNEWVRVCAYDKPGAWLRRTTINLATNARRSMRRELGAVLRLKKTITTVEIALTDDAVWAHVAKLPPRQRAAIALFYLEDRSVEDIAEIMECSSNTAKAHLHHGRQALATALGKENS